MSSQFSNHPGALELPHNDPINLAGNSSTWQSQGNSEFQKLRRLHNLASHVGVSNSPFLPKTVQEYGAHQVLYHQDRINEERKRTKNREAEKKTIKELTAGLKGEVKERERTRFKVQKLIGGHELENGDNLTAVLCKKSIWVAGAEESSVVWPSREELKWEGETQARQGLWRKLPLPKENKLKGTDRTEMISVGRGEDVEKMERGELVIPFQMKEVAEMDKFDETILGSRDRVTNALEIFQPNAPEKVEEIDEAEVRAKGLLGDLLKAL
jgi:hypothetical protein